MDSAPPLWTVPESQSVAAIPLYRCQSFSFCSRLLSALQESRFYTVHMHYVPCCLTRAAVTRHFSQHAGHPARTSLTHTIHLCGPCRRETDRWRRKGKASANGERDVSKSDSVISGKGRKWRKGRVGVRESPIKQKKRPVSVGRLPSDESRELEGKSYEVFVSGYM